MVWRLKQTLLRFKAYKVFGLDCDLAQLLGIPFPTNWRVSAPCSGHAMTTTNGTPTDRQLLIAANNGNATELQNLIKEELNLLFSTTPHKNNCLHIGVMLGHDQFVREVCNSNEEEALSLLLGTNLEDRTPLIAALMAANASLASFLIEFKPRVISNDLEHGERISKKMLLTADKRGDNALHHALRNGFSDIAVVLLTREPGLSMQVNDNGESPLHMACRRGYLEVVCKLIQIEGSPHFGPNGESALDAAIKYGHISIVRELLNERPQLASTPNDNGFYALYTAVIHDKLEMTESLLNHNPDQAYYISGGGGFTPFLAAAFRGFVSIAEVIMSHCPDAAYCTTEKDRSNALHVAITNERSEFVNFILKCPKLHRLINEQNKFGESPLHCAARKCNPEILRSLISHKVQDYSAVNSDNLNALNIIFEKTELWKTLKWTEAFTLLSNAIPSVISRLAPERATEEFIGKAKTEIKTLTKKYTTNTSLVAVLLATITFTAAFSLPGGYSNDPPNDGRHVFARKLAFWIFLISDTIAMCCSLAVAFLCILATWQDLDFLLNYRKSTRAMLWCAYCGVTTAFGTGLYTVLEPKSVWLAVLILVLSSLLMFLFKLIGEWPVLKMRLRLGCHNPPNILAVIEKAL